MTGRCAETCMSDDGECTCRPSSHDDEMARVDAQTIERRRANAVWAETTSAMERRDPPLRDRLDEDAVLLAQRTREMLS
ncbi:hypothetical protein [Azospirillum himalayense]|uniref:Uncharacterized protein n=1 Tax=Azospirillum himalayense TaxID=654847 RepID=A0ABW0FZ82_9PROT